MTFLCAHCTIYTYQVHMWACKRIFFDVNNPTKPAACGNEYQCVNKYITQVSVTIVQ